MTSLIPQRILSDFGKFGVGFDDLLDKITEYHDSAQKNVPNYPPYNIKKTNEYHYEIEMAVAGFAKTDISIETEGDQLIIKGNREQEDDGAEILHNGLAFRSFERKFTLNDQVEVKDAEMENGLLKIHLERIVPESKKPKLIEIK